MISTNVSYRDMKKNIKFLCLDDVKNGCSLKSTSKKYDVHLTTLCFWCKKAGIKSKYPAPGLKMSDREIMAYIKQKGFINTKHLQMKYHISNTHALRRLRKLEMKGMITHELVANKRFYKII